MRFWDLIALCSVDCNISSVLIFIIVFLLICHLTWKPAGLPPGPALTLPIVGDLLHLVGGDPLRAFRKLRRKYGDIYSFYIGRDLTVIINGYDLIQKAAVKNAHIFSGRPKNLITNVMGEGKGIVFTNEPHWKRQRKFTLSCLQEFGFGKTSLEESILKEVECFITVLKKQKGNPFNVHETIQGSMANIIFAIVCGKRHEYEDEFFVKFLRDSDLAARKVMQVSALLSCASVLQHIPGDPLGMNIITKSLEQWKDYVTKIYDEHTKTHDENSPRDLIDFFITEMSKKENLKEGSEFSVDQLNTVARDLFGAGSETSATVIRWALLYLLKYPEIQQRLQSEIDNVVPDGQLPSLEDRIKLPYVEAFIMEVLRCANVVPLSVPHSVTTENGVIIFEGYSIPQNTTVIFNLDSVLQDPDIFENPELFNPERYLNTDREVVKPKELIPFGIGRRVCLGEAVARMELFLFLATMIKTFDFSSEDEVKLDMKGILGVTYSPKPFKVRAVERRTNIPTNE